MKLTLLMTEVKTTLSQRRRTEIKHVNHEQNKGYGGNQKSCYNSFRIRFRHSCHASPRYQYTPKLIESMCYLIANDVHEVVLI